MDLDGNGLINFAEFVTMMRKCKVDTDFDRQIREAFKVRRGAFVTFVGSPLREDDWRGECGKFYSCLMRRLFPPVGRLPCCSQMANSEDSVVFFNNDDGFSRPCFIFTA